MTIQEFRAHKYLPVEWRRLLRTSPILQRVLAVMEENHPARFALRGDGNEDVSPTRAAIELGLTRGYSKFGDTLRLMAEPTERARHEDVGPPTYEPPPKQQNEPQYAR
jgi:hypothetical protein